MYAESHLSVIYNVIRVPSIIPSGGDVPVHQIWWKYLHPIGIIEIFRNLIWRPPPFWIFIINEFGTLRHDGSVS